VIARTLVVRAEVGDGRRPRADLDHLLDRHFRGSIPT
jgi:hypothetical protein